MVSVTTTELCKSSHRQYVNEHGYVPTKLYLCMRNGSFGGKGHVLKSIVVMIAQPGGCTKSRWIILKMGELYSIWIIYNKVVKKTLGTLKFEIYVIFIN